MSRRANNNQASAAAPSAGRASSQGKAMNLKGEGVASAVGKCVSVLYDEGSAELVAYRGVVVYVERIRRVGTARAPPHRPGPLRRAAAPGGKSLLRRLPP
jgi:hypothetical protein